MATKTQVGNLALIYMGVSQSLTDIDTDNSREAESLRVDDIPGGDDEG